MQQTILQPRQALNKAYLRLKTAHSKIVAFRKALHTLLDSLNPGESEEQARNHLYNFLKSVCYVNYCISTPEKTSLVIHTGADTNGKVAVLLEVKRPDNEDDIPTQGILNNKAVHKLLLNYLRERLKNNNHDLRHLIVTSVHEWFVFDVLEFDRLFYRNTQLREDFTDWDQGRKVNSSTDFFCEQIAASAIASISESISYTFFNLKDYEKALRDADMEDDVKLVELFKLLSPPHLLKEDPKEEQVGENSSPVCYAHLKEMREGFEE